MSNIKTNIQIHRLSTPIYWRLRFAGYSNLEAEQEIVRYKKWLRKALDCEAPEELIG